MYDLYIANKNYSSWSLRPWVLMQELAIPFKERVNEFRSENWDAFRKFSPSGRVPCLVDGATTVWDSLAITEYLAERHPGVWPVGAAERAWARCAAAEMHSGFATLRSACPMNCGLRVRLHEIGVALRKDVARVDELWQEGLQRHGGAFLAGNTFSAVDAFFAPVAYRVQTYQLPLSATSQAYVAQLLGLGAMQRWYADALRETWREAEHEAEALASGTVIADYRVNA